MSPKALLITGASRGIGRASALLAAKHGWSVGVNYRNDVDAAEEVVRAIAKAGGRAVPLKGDVAIEADIVAMFEQATQALGLLTEVVVNAGIIAPTARLVEPLCRLCGLERRDRHADPGARQGAGPRGRARQRHPAGTGRHANPRERRRARPRPHAWTHESSWEAGYAGRDRGGDRLAPQRRRLLRDRRAPRCQRREVSASVSFHSIAAAQKPRGNGEGFWTAISHRFSRPRWRHVSRSRVARIDPAQVAREV